MSIFQYQGQEEDHYTNILMNILDYNNQSILPHFLKGLIRKESQDFQFASLSTVRVLFCTHISPRVENYVTQL